MVSSAARPEPTAESADASSSVMSVERSALTAFDGDHRLGSISLITSCSVAPASSPFRSVTSASYTRNSAVRSGLELELPCPRTGQRSRFRHATQYDEPLDMTNEDPSSESWTETTIDELTAGDVFTLITPDGGDSPAAVVGNMRRVALGNLPGWRVITASGLHWFPSGSRVKRRSW